MAAPLILGGIQVPLHAGAPDCTYAGAGGSTDTVMSDGAIVRSRHFSKEVITLSGSGWMATGLDALDWDANHLLLCPKPKRVATITSQVTLTCEPRPDVAVVAQALVGREWIGTPVSLVERVVTITPVSGASQYSVAWYPQFTVICQRPAEENSGGGAAWQLVCREQ